MHRWQSGDCKLSYNLRIQESPNGQFSSTTSSDELDSKIPNLLLAWYVHIYSTEPCRDVKGCHRQCRIASFM
eukprot:3081734-Amphidinium_carterae.1